ncbi:unnamed protein product [Polarella glacialis]|uniref:Uncharacterized protein n=1 Tax=Polarella glacialis TaxID=89957 RepID=A0A813FZH8_POLGL|nr:unnamed protein product [Polarella glacialis]CAE8617551.1 unnamed protein product [Polarella glacialis]
MAERTVFSSAALVTFKVTCETRRIFANACDRAVPWGERCHRSLFSGRNMTASIYDHGFYDGLDCRTRVTSHGRGIRLGHRLHDLDREVPRGSPASKSSNAFRRSTQQRFQVPRGAEVQQRQFGGNRDISTHQGTEQFMNDENIGRCQDIMILGRAFSASTQPS